MPTTSLEKVAKRPFAKETLRLYLNVVPDDLEMLEEKDIQDLQDDVSDLY